MVLLQQIGEETKNAIYELSYQIYETGIIPKYFGSSKIVILLKISSFQVHTFKKKKARLAKYQYGFRKNKGIREVTLDLRILLEKYIEIQKITYIAFVDLEKTFDRWTGQVH